jgi:hypothetical protein
MLAEDELAAELLLALLLLELEFDGELRLELEKELLLLELALDGELRLELLAELGGTGCCCVFAIMVLTVDQFPAASPALTP